MKTPSEPIVEQGCTLETYKCEWLIAAGIEEYEAANILIHRESSWNPQAVNISSGAFGLAQCLDKPADALCYSDNPVEQLVWMREYVANRYGSYAEAVAFHDQMNWY